MDYNEYPQAQLLRKSVVGEPRATRIPQEEVFLASAWPLQVLLEIMTIRTPPNPPTADTPQLQHQRRKHLG